MPGEDEILDNQSADDQELESQDPDVEVEPDSEVEAEEEVVPARRFKGAIAEKNAKLRERQQEIEQLRETSRLHELRALQMQQVLLQQQNQGRVQELDPEIEKSLAPYLSPIKQQLDYTQQMLNQKTMELEADRAIAYIEKNFPEIDDYKEAIAEELEDLSPSTRNAILGDPKAFVRFAKSIKAEAQKIPESRAAKEVIRSRAKSESGMSTNRQAQTKSIADLQGKAFTQALKEMGYDVEV